MPDMSLKEYGIPSYMNKFYKKILLVLLLAMVLALLFWSASMFARTFLRAWCRDRGVEYHYADCRFRLPGNLTLAGFQLQKSGEFSFSAEHIELRSSLRAWLFGNWNVISLHISNGTLDVQKTRHGGKLHLSQLSVELYQIALGKAGSGTLKAHIEEIDLQQRGFWYGGSLEINGSWELSRESLFDRLQGTIFVTDVGLTQKGESSGTLSGAADYAFRQEAVNFWQIIPLSGAGGGLNQIRVGLSGREILHAVVRSGIWKKEAERQEASIELTASCVDSDPLLGLFFPEAYAWASGKLNFLQMDLRSMGTESDSLFLNMEGSIAFDITELHLKNSPFIEVLSKRTALELSEFLLFDQGSGILKISNQSCRLLTTTPFRGQHPVIEANGTVTYDGAMQLRLELGFSPELEKMLSTKRYFHPFAMLCRRNNGYLMLPGSLTLTGTLESPAVDLTELLRASAKAGMKNLFEDAAGRIGIRLQRTDKDAKKTE